MALVRLNMENQQEADRLKQWLEQYRNDRAPGLIVHEGTHDALAGEDIPDHHVMIEADQSVIDEALHKHFTENMGGHDWHDFQIH